MSAGLSSVRAGRDGAWPWSQPCLPTEAGGTTGGVAVCVRRKFARLCGAASPVAGQRSPEAAKQVARASPHQSLRPSSIRLINWEWEVDPDKVMKVKCAEWEGRWRTQGWEHIRDIEAALTGSRRDALEGLAAGEDSGLGRITADAVRRVASAMSASTAVDAAGWAPKDVKQVCEQGRAELSDILREAYESVALPAGDHTASCAS